MYQAFSAGILHMKLDNLKLSIANSSCNGVKRNYRNNYLIITVFYTERKSMTNTR